MNYNENVWYGEFGGCFISDAFTLACDRYYEEFKEAVADFGFQEEYRALKEKYRKNGIRFERDKENGTIICYTAENYGPILGTALLGKRLGRQAVCGVRYADEALVCARVCAELGVELQLFLAHELGGLKTLTDELTRLGVGYDTKMCSELFNLPEMYAFQAWVSAPDEKHLINCRSNVGAFPQTNIAAAFAADYCEGLIEAAEQKFGEVHRVVLPVVSGTAALAVITSAKEAKEFVCVECDTEPDLTEELDSYCGSFTKVMRNRYTDRVLAAELVNLMEQGKVIRTRTTSKEITGIQISESVSLQSLAALQYCGQHPADGNTLVMVRQIRWGGAV